MSGRCLHRRPRCATATSFPTTGLTGRMRQGLVQLVAPLGGTVAVIARRDGAGGGGGAQSFMPGRDSPVRSAVLCQARMGGGRGARSWGEGSMGTLKEHCCGSTGLGEHVRPRVARSWFNWRGLDATREAWVANRAFRLGAASYSVSFAVQ